MIMGLSDDLKQSVADLVAEDGAVITALNDLAAKAAANGSVSDADVQAAADVVKSEVSKLSAAVAADDSAPAAPAAPEAVPAEPNTPEVANPDGTSSEPQV